MFWFVTAEAEGGDIYCCVHASSLEKAELIALDRLSEDEEVYCTTAVEFNQSEHGDPRDYELFS